MSRAKVVLLSLLAMLAVSGLASATAAATTHNFKIAGTEIKGTEKEELKVQGQRTKFKTQIAGVKVIIECDELTGPSSANTIEKEGKSKFEFQYRNCTVAKIEAEKFIQLPECKVTEPFTIKGEGLLTGIVGLPEDELKGSEAEEKLGTLEITVCAALKGIYAWLGAIGQEFQDPASGRSLPASLDFYFWQTSRMKIKAGEPVYAFGSTQNNTVSGKAYGME